MYKMNLIRDTCLNCTNQPVYGYPNGIALYCVEHKKENHIDVVKERHKKQVERIKLLSIRQCDRLYSCQNKSRFDEMECSECGRKHSLCADLNCKTCSNNSLVPTFEPGRTILWASPRHIIRTSKRPIRVRCDICKREEELSVNEINKKCNTCRKLNTVTNNVLFSDNILFSTHERYKHVSWQENLEYAARATVSSKNGIWFTCEVGHEFCSSPHSIVSNKKWCPTCADNKSSEYKICKFLTDNGFHCERQKYFKECKIKFCLLFDIFIPELNIIVECDGPHHFKQTSNWVSSRHIQVSDAYKTLFIADQNISIIRIVQSDMKKIDWKSELLEMISSIRQSNLVPSVGYIGNNIEIYRQYDYLLDNYSIEQLKTMLKISRNDDIWCDFNLSWEIIHSTAKELEEINT